MAVVTRDSTSVLERIEDLASVWPTPEPPPARRPAPRRGRPPRRPHRRGHIHWVRIAVLITAVAALVWGLTDDLLTQARLHDTEVEQTGARQSTAVVAHELVAAQRNLAALIKGQSTDQVALNQVEGELSAAQQRLSQAQQGLALSNLDVASIHACINGSASAIAQIAIGQEQAAINAIAGVATVCESLETPGPGSPVYPFDFPDPDVINVAGTYFAYGTNAAGGNVQIIDSTDLAHWSTVGDALPALPAWATPGSTWAPGILQLPHGFVMFYATHDGSTECISVATATAPQGPFVDRSSGPIICQTGLGGSIDPAPFLSASGSPYLVWKSNGGSGQPATIWGQPLNASGTSLEPGTTAVALLRPTQAWENGVVEGPSMWAANGTYYLFYSGNNWDSGNYAEGVATCSGPLGPCGKPLGGPILGSQSNLSGPGGASVFVDAHGNPWIAFHAWLPAAVGYPNARLLFLRPLGFSGGIPVVEPPG